MNSGELHAEQTPAMANVDSARNFLQRFLSDMPHSSFTNICFFCEGELAASPLIAAKDSLLGIFDCILRENI